jgi:hypothetical protein
MTTFEGEHGALGGSHLISEPDTRVTMNFARETYAFDKPPEFDETSIKEQND